MPSIQTRSARRPLNLRARKAVAAAALAVLGAAATAAHAAVALDPLLAGQYAAGTGANAVFNRIDGSWQGSTVYWNTATQTYSNTPGAGYVQIGTQGWGTGVWGLQDWATVNTPGSGAITNSWSGVVATIDHGDAHYRNLVQNGLYSGWGMTGALPTGLFPGDDPDQDNWTAHYSGYLRITEAGLYNFGVLYDDGFFLRIWGADGSAPIEISKDFLNPRDRLGFDEDLALGTGLYRFELGAYDRLEAGVVNLAWHRGDGEWSTVPTENLVTNPLLVAAVPLPGSAALLLAGITGFAAARRKAAK